MQRKRTCIYGLYFAVKWQFFCFFFFLSQYYCLHLFSIKMLPHGNGWNWFPGWSSFMVMVLYRLSPEILLSLMSDSAACYFQHPSPSVFTPFFLQTLFLWTSLDARETFLALFPRWKRASAGSCVPPLLQFFSSPHPKRRSETSNNGAVGLLFCTLVRQILWFNRLSIYMSAIDLCFFLGGVGTDSREKLDRQSTIKANSWAFSRLLNVITLSIKVRLKLNIFLTTLECCACLEN